MLGFETIGNATVICHDDRPILVTDPWLTGTAYFGSWRMSHQVPADQLAHARACPFVWVSHGHPDHLSGDSLQLFSDKEILIPGHLGSRIHRDLSAQGFRTRILPEREWVSLSPRIRILCVSDWNQDAILLIEVGDTLLVNLNDASPTIWQSLVRKEVARHRKSIMLKTFGYGDVDMINYFTESRKRIEPPAAQKPPVGIMMQRWCESYGVDMVVPFSSFHEYQRTDSAWVRPYTTPLDAYQVGFSSKKVSLLPAFVSYNLAKNTVTQINPAAHPGGLVEPSVFGDDWSEPLQADEEKALRAYFAPIDGLHQHFRFIRFRVGGRETLLELSRRGDRGLTFEVPRHSLMTAIKWHVFDDLLIANFMRTVLHGRWSFADIGPLFSVYVAKFADNGGARSNAEVRHYLSQYRERAPLDYFRSRVELASAQKFRGFLAPGTPLFNAAKRVYWVLKGARQ